jgi:signal transduction histidine kinase
MTIEAGDAPTLEGDSEDEFVQVLDEAGRVVDASPNVDGKPALADLAPEETVRLEAVPFEDGSFLVVAVAARSPQGLRTITVGRNLDDIGEATGAVAPLLAAGVPVLVMVVAGVTWWITGRALQPVESIRAEVEAISATGLDRRVPEPTTGDEIARLAVTMNRMLARLESSQARQRRFVSDAAHELRSPVASIRQHTEVALTHPDDTPVGDLADIVHTENLRVEQLVDDLLLLARLDEGEVAGDEQVDLDDIVLAEASRLHATTPFTIDTTGVGAGRVLGHASELERVVRNLADNAARHAESTIALGVSDTGASVVLTIDDDGPGIDEAHRDKVFDRFVRLDGARARDGGGAGLGLSIVRAVVEAHGGEVSASKGPRGGARVRARLPSAPA